MNIACVRKCQGGRREICQQMYSKILRYLQNMKIFNKNTNLNNPRKESLLKTFWEKERILLTSIFSYFYTYFFSAAFHKNV